MQHKQSRILVGGTHSGIGKTTITMGLAASYHELGYKVQCFKIGPDYLDAVLLAQCSHQPCYNLDTWLTSQTYMDEQFSKCDAQIILVEGVMGFFDHQEIIEYIQRYRLTPLLVFSATGIAASAQALVSGYARYDHQVQIAGVIANHCSSSNHKNILQQAIAAGEKKYSDFPSFLGGIPKQTSLQLPERHLGLAVSPHQPLTSQQLSSIKKMVQEHLDLKSLQKISTISNPKKLFSSSNLQQKTTRNFYSINKKNNIQQPVLAYAWDEAFYFYYPDNLQMLTEAGFDLKPFSPIHSTTLPADTRFIYIGGGYPENYCQQLADNHKLLRAIQSFANNQDGFIYAECGGLMYLSQGIYNQLQDFYPLIGLLDFKTEIMQKFQKLTYVEVKILADCLLGNQGWLARGHEYHYSKIYDTNKDDHKNQLSDVASQSYYFVRERRSKKTRLEGYQYKNTFASYVHIHFASQPKIPEFLYKKSQSLNFPDSLS